jgi:hypothetical protein
VYNFRIKSGMCKRSMMFGLGSFIVFNATFNNISVL